MSIESELEKTPEEHVDEISISSPKPTSAYSAFSPSRRLTILVIITAANCLGPLAGNIYLPAIPSLAAAFESSYAIINASVSAFMAIFAVAPLMWASWSDFRGRKPVYLISLSIFVASNILLATVPKNIAALMILRILQAFGASSVSSVGAGTVADLVETEKRATAISIFLLGHQLGLNVGPPIGGAITNAGSWRWMFGFLAILSGVVIIFILFLLPETLRALVGNGEEIADTPILILPPTFTQACTVDPELYPRAPPPGVKSYLTLLRYPPILLVSLNGAIMFCAYFTVAVSFPAILAEEYGFTTVEIGYAYLVPGVALVVGSVGSGRYSDLRLKRAMAAIQPASAPPSDIGDTMESGMRQKPIPERRLNDQIWGVLLSIAGTLIYGWLVHFRFHWGTVLAATFLCGVGLTWVLVTSTSYLTECSPRQSATLVAVAGLLRNPSAAVGAAIIDPLMTKMGIGWCFTGVAGMIVCVLGILLVVIHYGAGWRKKRGEPQ